MKGDILFKFLSFLEKQAINQADFIEAVLVSGYGAGMSKIDFEYRKIKKRREVSAEASVNLVEDKKKLVAYLSKIKRDGLIVEDPKTKSLIVSKKGKRKLEELNNRLPDKSYKKEKSSNVAIISFDIPEDMRRSRDWFREVVRNLGFQMIHKSVWIGKVKIPVALIQALGSLNLLDHVEIFEVTKSGTLKKIN